MVVVTAGLRNGEEVVKVIEEVEAAIGALNGEVEEVEVKEITGMVIGEENGVDPKHHKSTKISHRLGGLL